MTALISDDKAQSVMSASKAVGLIVTLMVFGVIAAVMLPIAIDEIEGDTTDVFTQDNQTAIEVNSQLNSTVTAVDTVASPNTVTVELNDTRESGTTSKTIDNGTTANYTMFDGQNVEVGIEDATSGSPDTATVNYTYASDYTYGDAARSIWSILGLVLVLAAFLFIIGAGMSVSRI